MRKPLIEILQKMFDADRELYMKVLSTPEFAESFNELVFRARAWDYEVKTLDIIMEPINAASSAKVGG